MSLTIDVPKVELFNEATGEFYYSRDYRLVLEHSLVSLSKWESRWHKPFLTSKNKTRAEILDYIRCMTITQNIPDEAYSLIGTDLLDKIGDYISDSMTATTFSDKEKGRISREIITSEIIYYSMITYNIPMECQKWHLNRLLTLIKVCDLKNRPAKKMSRQELAARNRALNEQRKAALSTTG